MNQRRFQLNQAPSKQDRYTCDAVDISLIFDNLLTPPILFFGLGMFASLVKSDLEIPQPIARFMSLYLLFAIGLHGGMELSAGALSTTMVLTLVGATATAALFPIATASRRPDGVFPGYLDCGD